MDTTNTTIELDRDMVADFPPRSVILDFYCGRGGNTFYLEEMGHKATGIDTRVELIEDAVKRRDEKGSSVEFSEADGRFLPFDDRSFDICVMNGFLGILPDSDSRIRSILEAFRVIKEGGGIYVADFLRTADSDLYKERYEFYREETGEEGTFIVTEDGSLGGSELIRAHHHTEEEIRSLLRSRFEVIQEEICEFPTFHGNKANGIKLLAYKK